MATLQSWRKAYGALKDQTKVGLAHVNSDFKVVHCNFTCNLLIRTCCLNLCLCMIRKWMLRLLKPRIMWNALPKNDTSEVCGFLLFRICAVDFVFYRSNWDFWVAMLGFFLMWVWVFVQRFYFLHRCFGLGLMLLTAYMLLLGD